MFNVQEIAQLKFKTSATCIAKGFYMYILYPGMHTDEGLHRNAEVLHMPS